VIYCHLTSVHAWDDTRIFMKMCRSLAAAGHTVHLVAPRPPEAPPLEVRDNVHIHAVPRHTNRWRRVTHTLSHVWRRAYSLQADLYHLHDPELMPIGLRLKARGHCVVFDFHEDFPSQIRSKHWIPRGLRLPVSVAAGWSENLAAWGFDGIVAATPHIATRFSPARCVAINNFARLEEFPPPSPAASTASPRVAYVGGLSAERGLKEMVDAIALLPPERSVRLLLAGRFIPPAFEADLRRRRGWERVEYRGYCTREEVARLLGEARIGICTLRPAARYLDSQPVKLFEYMAAGLPVIASDFALWRNIVEGERCGLVVNPMDSVAIARAMEMLLNDPREAERMGHRGRRAVCDRYQWESEFGKLARFYEEILSGARHAGEAGERRQCVSG